MNTILFSFWRKTWISTQNFLSWAKTCSYNCKCYQNIAVLKTKQQKLTKPWVFCLSFEFFPWVFSFFLLECFSKCQKEKPELTWRGGEWIFLQAFNTHEDHSSEFRWGQVFLCKSCSHWSNIFVTWNSKSWKPSKTGKDDLSLCAIENDYFWQLLTLKMRNFFVDTRRRMHNSGGTFR